MFWLVILSIWQVIIDLIRLVVNNLLTDFSAGVRLKANLQLTHLLFSLGFSFFLPLFAASLCQSPESEAQSNLA
jgi:hypothetical protein